MANLTHTLDVCEVQLHYYLILAPFLLLLFFVITLGRLTSCPLVILRLVVGWRPWELSNSLDLQRDSGGALTPVTHL